jgi:hypothetical protein
MTSMFDVRAFTAGAMYGGLHVASHDRALGLVACAMAPPAGDYLARVLTSAAALAGVSDGAPLRAAEALLAQLSRDGGDPDRVSWLIFAGVLIRPGGVEVCHAGDLRVQLVVDGAVAASTVDHTMGNLHPAARGTPQEHVCMRSLSHREPVPEHATWPAPAGRATIRVTSQDVHAHRPSSEVIAFPTALATRAHAGAALEIGFGGAG